MRQKEYFSQAPLARTGKFQKIVSGANQCPLGSDFVEPTKQKLAETSV
jgi:hypothetical protein